MKKFILVFIIILSLLVVGGCRKSKSTAEIGNEYDLDIDVEEGRFQIICVNSSNGKMGVEYTTIETTNYDEYQYMINKKVKTINKYETDDEYKKFKKKYSEVELENTDTTKYKYYDKDRAFVWVSMEEIDKSLYVGKEDTILARYYIIQHNNDKYKCAIKGVSLSDLV